MRAGGVLVDKIVQLRHAHDNRNAAAMSTLREHGAARLGAFHTDKTAWGEQFETKWLLRKADGS
jgi:hypothetical protein